MLLSSNSNQLFGGLAASMFEVDGDNVSEFNPAKLLGDDPTVSSREVKVAHHATDANGCKASLSRVVTIFRQPTDAIFKVGAKPPDDGNLLFAVAGIGPPQADHGKFRYLFYLAKRRQIGTA